ncbi:MAG TPA: hypothetical protein VFL62_19120 [Bradyrhizobium sp.]|uniref:hypothetical protein n=1 Tax=Bradyrhizobium sp. TaxID=376 RepID=UPI002D7EE5D1|nr:hypothetical protein [Bradyrhizobium sp.]HET7888340.1 hypothetical protein [Bradyrhizobium sp.]
MRSSAAANDSNPGDDTGTDWIAAMRAGDFARAWEINDCDMARSRSVKHEGPRHLQRIWRGEPLRGRRVLVRCYHGLGDTIQFARFLSPLRQIASHVTVWCQPALVAVIAKVDGVDRVLPLNDRTPEVDFDVDVEIMELPHAIRATRQQVEMRHPYLRPGAGNRSDHRTGGNLFSIGLCWDVGDWDRRRVVPPALFRWLKQPGVQFYSVQAGDVAEVVRKIGAIDISTPDIDILSARLQRLDLCICPDTMLAHLSAALGCTTWVMLHSECDWRWPARADTTIWYPTMRLFRQKVAGDWSPVGAEIRSALASEIARRGHDRRILRQ